VFSGGVSGKVRVKFGRVVVELVVELVETLPRHWRRRLFEQRFCLAGRLPNTACTRRVGVGGIFKLFLASGFSYISSRVHARPHAGNANRWALVIIQKTFRWCFYEK